MEQNKRLFEIVKILRKNEVFNGMTPEKMTAVFADLGPTFIKLGQVLAMRRDILPKEYCDQLMSLQTSVNPISYNEVISVIKEELGENITDEFVYIDKKPLGSASIAQVHRAKLKDGKEVVIKVQRPGIYETMEEDITLIKRAAKMLNRFASKTPIGVIDFEATIDEFWETTKEELDFKTEANNLKTFKTLNSDINYIESPGVYEEMSTDKVLVMDYIPGIDIDQLETLKSSGYDLDALAEKLCTNYIKQVITDGFFHADPHPGNIRVDGEEIAWIDLGMTGSLSDRDRKLFHKALMAIAFNDSEELTSAFLSLGVQNGRVDRAQLFDQVDSILEGATRSRMKSARTN